MSRFILALLLLAASAFAAVDLSKPIPQLALPDGRVLKNVTFANFKSDTVLVRHAGGAIALRYEFLPDSLRDDIEAKRPGGPRPGSGAAVGGERVKYSGQVFVTTRGAGAYKFSGITVYAFPMSALVAWESNINPVALPRPLARATTDADGKFTIAVAKDELFFLFAQATRYTGETERHDFRLPSTEIKSADSALMDNSRLVSHRIVRIEGD